MVSQRISDDALYRDLRDRIESLHAAGVRDVWRVGDCVAPRPLGFTVAAVRRNYYSHPEEDALVLSLAMLNAEC